MELLKKLFIFLAIFCVLGSAAAVCAADDGGYDGLGHVDEAGYAVSQYSVDDGYAGSQYQDDGGYAGSQYDDTDEGLTDRPIIDPDYAHMEHAAGEPVNETSNATANATAPVAGNTTNATSNSTANATASQSMLATGNPILILLAVGAVLGGCVALRKK